MPNLKLYTDQSAGPEVITSLSSALPRMRALLCDVLEVGPAACQLAIVPVLGLPDQPAINAELMILPSEKRSADLLRGLASALRQAITEVAGMHAAIRISQLDPASYIALK